MLRVAQSVKLVSRHAIRASTALYVSPAAIPHAWLHSSCITGAKAKKSKASNTSADPVNTPSDNLLELDMMLEDAQQKLEQIQQGLTDALANIRGGGMAPDMLDHVSVQAYGDPTPLADVAQVAVKSATMLVVTPYDPEVCAAQVSVGSCGMTAKSSPCPARLLTCPLIPHHLSLSRILMLVSVLQTWA